MENENLNGLHRDHQLISFNSDFSFRKITICQDCQLFLGSLSSFIKLYNLIRSVTYFAVTFFRFVATVWPVRKKTFNPTCFWLLPTLNFQKSISKIWIRNQNLSKVSASHPKIRVNHALQYSFLPLLNFKFNYFLTARKTKFY